MKKVSLDLLLRDVLGTTLGEAKHLVDEILDGHVVTIDVPARDAERIAAEIDALGANVERVEDETGNTFQD